MFSGDATRSRDTHRLAAGIYTLVGAVIAILYLVFQSQSPKVEYFFDDEKTVREWNLQGQAQGKLEADGLVVEPRGAALLISPKLRDPGNGPLNWSDSPYVRLRLAPHEEDRRMALVWIVDLSSQLQRHIVFTVPAGVSEVLIDVRQRLPWERRFGWDRDSLSGVPIRYLGLLIEHPIKVREFAVLSSLGMFQLFRLMWSQYWTVEPIKVNSINDHYGNELLGMPLSAVFGVVLAILFLLALVIRRERFRRALSWFMLACLVAPVAPFILTLGDQARSSSEISAWHADRYDEYRSRFGKEFADLDREFRKHVPAGTRVAFPDPKQLLVLGESNWLWFLYYGEFDNYKDRKRDSAHLDSKTRYVFYYHPEKLVHDEKSNTLRSTKKGQAKKTWETRTVVHISEQAKILEIIRD